MGCDIHLRVQHRAGVVWFYSEKQVPDKYREGQTTHERWYDGRNYRLFAMLADVRNGVGFAGVDTGNRFNPIAEQRGLPEGIDAYIGKTNDDYEFWFGDHSFSWLTLTELLEYDWYQQTKCRGWVNGPQFEKWDRMRPYQPEPDEHCGGVSGGTVEHISEQEMRRRINEIKGMVKSWTEAEARIKQLYGSTYCQIEWPVFYSEAAGSFYTQTMPRMMNLAKTVGGPENVRIVFGFDS